MVPLLTPYDIPFPQNGGSICPQDTRIAIKISATGDPIHFMFGSRPSRVGYRVLRVGGSNGAISGYIKSKLAAGPHLE